VKDANNVTLGRLLFLAPNSGTPLAYGVTVLTSTGYQVTIPFSGNLSTNSNTQIYFTTTDCSLGASDSAWINTGTTQNSRPTYGKLAVWASSVNSYLVPKTFDANFVSMSEIVSGVQAILNNPTPTTPTGCAPSTSSQYGWALRKATMTELGLPATIAGPLQLPTN
jgi:hypothetical protein